MNPKAQINPITIFGIVFILAALAVSFFLLTPQLPSFESLSLRFIFCGGADSAPAFNPLDFSTFLPNFLFNLCVTALPVLAGILLGIFLVAYLISIDPKLLISAPIVLVAVFALGFFGGFLISGIVLDFWWLFIIFGIVIFAVKRKFFP